MYIARRDFFVSGEASCVNTFLTIAVLSNILAGSRPQSVVLAQKIAGRCSQSKPEPAAPAGESQSKLSTVALWNAAAGAIKSLTNARIFARIGAANQLGGGGSYPRGSGSLTPPPRADSLTFKNRRSETGCAISLYLYRDIDISIYISIYRCPPKADSNSSLKHKASRSLNAASPVRCGGRGCRLGR